LSGLRRRQLAWPGLRRGYATPRHERASRCCRPCGSRPPGTGPQAQRPHRPAAGRSAWRPPSRARPRFPGSPTRSPGQARPARTGRPARWRKTARLDASRGWDQLRVSQPGCGPGQYRPAPRRDRCPRASRPPQTSDAALSRVIARSSQVVTVATGTWFIVQRPRSGGAAGGVLRLRAPGYRFSHDLGVDILDEIVRRPGRPGRTPGNTPGNTDIGLSRRSRRLALDRSPT
jgi:hypothetical protein